MSDTSINFDNVSRFYGEVLGVNRVTLSLPPGITSLVGPNGSGKTTLDEFDDRPGAAHARPDLGARHRAVGTAEAFQAGGIRDPVRFLSQGAERF